MFDLAAAAASSSTAAAMASPAVALLTEVVPVVMAASFVDLTASVAAPLHPVSPALHSFALFLLALSFTLDSLAAPFESPAGLIMTVILKSFSPALHPITALLHALAFPFLAPAAALDAFGFAVVPSGHAVSFLPMVFRVPGGLIAMVAALIGFLIFAIALLGLAPFLAGFFSHFTFLAAGHAALFALLAALGAGFVFGLFAFLLVFDLIVAFVILVLVAGIARMLDCDLIILGRGQDEDRGAAD